MYECNAMQILETKKEKTQKPENNGHKVKVMKHKDDVKKTQLVWIFCIQNFLDAPRALEFVFTLEWFPTPRLE